MENTIDDLKMSFQISYDAYALSRARAQEVIKLFHNRQYTASQMATLRSRGAPAETFNIVKLFARVLLGYYSTVVNSVQASPTHPRDAVVASLANDIVEHTLRVNQFETEGDNCKLDLLLAGLACAKRTPEPTGLKDEFGRPINQIKLSYVPQEQVLPDPMSTKADYSDARFLHRYKWITSDTLAELIKDTKWTLDDFDSEHNHTVAPEADFSVGGQSGGFQGYYQGMGSYLLVETVLRDSEGVRWETLWIDEIMIHTEEITYQEVEFPYRLQKLYETQDAEYYGIFEDVIESQHAINQALVKLQQMVNTQKVFYEKKAVKNAAKFRSQINRINAIIEVEDLQGIKVETLSQNAIEQYQAIDRALERVKMVLGVTDSFLGMAFASDSGRKVKLQQNATAMALRHVTVRIEQFYRLLGWDIINLAKQFYYASMILRLTDKLTGDRWVNVNQPLKRVRSIDANGQPVEEKVYEEVIDPKTGEPMVNEDGQLVLAPVPRAETALAFTDMDVSMDSVSYNDEDEKTQLLMEQVLSGPMGQSLQAISPGHYMRVVSLIMKTTKTRYSGQIADIFEDVAMMMNQEGAEGAPSAAPNFNQSRKSQALKLPQNTNEGAG